MKPPSTTYIALWSSLALALTTAVWLPAQTTAAEPENAKPMTEEKMKGCCAAMKTQMGKMKTDVKAQDDALTKHVAEMNNAPADQKLSVMAAVITHMAEDRIVMDAHMDTLHMAMRQHIMQHMSMSKESLAECPMMQGMDEKSADAKK